MCLATKYPNTPATNTGNVMPRVKYIAPGMPLVSLKVVTKNTLLAQKPVAAIDTAIGNQLICLLPIKYCSFVVYALAEYKTIRLVIRNNRIE